MLVRLSVTKKLSKVFHWDTRMDYSRHLFSLFAGFWVDTLPLLTITLIYYKLCTQIQSRLLRKTVIRYFFSIIILYFLRSLVSDPSEQGISHTLYFLDPWLATVPIFGAVFTWWITQLQRVDPWASGKAIKAGWTHNGLCISFSFHSFESSNCRGRWVQTIENTTSVIDHNCSLVFNVPAFWPAHEGKVLDNIKLNSVLVFFSEIS